MNPKDLLYPFLAALCYSTNPIMVKLGLRSSNEPLLGAAIGMTASTIVYLAYFLAAGRTRELFAVPQWVGWYFAASGLCSTLGVMSFFASLQYIPASVVAPLTGAAPLVTVTLSHFWLREVERVTFHDIVGTVLIVLGVVLLVG
ncbi:MAG: DMT family transporter [Deltaproteobacteria bacterium]|nr:DMT family transporter [Deltaproteobacteria bacterium]